MLQKKIYVVLLCCSVVAACGTPPKRNSPINAEELAQLQPVVNQRQPEQSANLPIVEQPQAQPLKEVNQLGQVPLVPTLAEQTLNLSGNETVELNSEQASLRSIIEEIAVLLELNVVIDPSISDQITLRFSEENPIRKKDLWPLLQLLLSDAGVTMTKRGNVYHFKKTGASKLPGAIGITPETLTNSTSPEVLQITPLRYLTAEAAQTLINPLIQPKGHIITLPSLNVIGIVTTPQHLKRINNLLRIVDADPFLHRGMRLFRLFNSKATEVQAELEKILKALYGKTPPTYEVVGLERINAILVIAPPNSGFNEVALWVDILDERSEESGEQVFIYKVKNLEASKLASTLSNVFKIDKKAADNKNRQQRNQSQQSSGPPGARGATSRTGTTQVSAELNVTLVADESTNSLLIRATPRDYRQLLETIYLLDQVPKEVMINVVLAEVKLTKATQFGIDWHALFIKNHGTIGSNVQVPTGNYPVEGGEASALSGFSGLTINYLSGGVDAVLNLVASNNELSLLSRPSLLVRNNEEASINIGSNEPFLSGVNSSTVNNQILSNDVQYKDTGITVKVSPRINDDGIINMKIYQELSQLGEPRTAQNLQSFIQRKIETSVVVRDGSAIIIGGLIQTIERDNQQGIPVLKDIPIIGSLLFSSIDQNLERTELVLIIVPQIVNPEADNSPLVQHFKQRLQMVSKLLNKQHVLMDELPAPPTQPMRKQKLTDKPNVQVMPPNY